MADAPGADNIGLTVGEGDRLGFFGHPHVGHEALVGQVPGQCTCPFGEVNTGLLPPESLTPRQRLNNTPLQEFRGSLTDPAPFIAHPAVIHRSTIARAELR